MRRVDDVLSSPHAGVPATDPMRLQVRQQPWAVRFARMSALAGLTGSMSAFHHLASRDLGAGLFTLHRGDPYPLYERMRAEGPVGRSRLGFFYTTEHDLASQVLTSRSWGPTMPDGPDAWFAEVDLSLLQLEPPDHTRLRRVVTPAFTRRRMEGYRHRIENTLDDILGRVDPEAPWDLVSTLSGPLPIAVITDLLGIGPHDEGAFLRYGHAMAAALDGVRSPRHASELLNAERGLEEIFTRLFAERAADPREDVISAVVAARDEGRIAPEDMVALCSLLLLAGFETTVNVISSTVALLLHRPEQWRLVVDDPNLAAAAVEETLRYFPPVQLTVRYAQEDVELAGRTMPRGSQLLPLIAATGRDPKVFERPDVFDITRTDAGNHLAFSAGAHYCLGAPLARLEATLAIEALATRMPDLRLAGPILSRSGVTLRGPQHLPVR